jgi:DNA ligase 1
MTTPTKTPSAQNIFVSFQSIAMLKRMDDRVTQLKNMDDDISKRVMYYACNPYITFGVKVEPLYKYYTASSNGTTPKLSICDQEFWDFLDRLSKSTGSSNTKKAAITAIALTMDGYSFSLMHHILEKNLGKNISAKTINKAFPDFIPLFAVQLSQKLAVRKISFPAYVEPKYDGMRAIGLVYKNGETQIVSREGRDIPAAENFKPDLEKLAVELFKQPEYKDASLMIIDGELIDGSFNDSISSFRSNTVATTGSFMVFDAVHGDAMETGESRETYLYRRAILENVFTGFTSERIEISPKYVINSAAEMWNIYKIVREANYEGLIIKNANGKWTKRRTYDWMKIKAKETADIRIVGAFEGEGEIEDMLGGLIVDFNGVLVRVGSGFKLEERERYWKLFCKDVEDISGGIESENYNIVGKLAEVSFQEITPDGSLRHPVFHRLRLDKDEVSF